MLTGVCLIGSGGIASAHADALARAGVRRRWVVSRRSEAAEHFGGEWGFDHSGTSLEDAFADEEVDVVIIASPSQVHAEQAALALRAGKHVIVEIPAALTLEDCDRLGALAEQVSRRVFVCHTMRSFPAVREVRARVEGDSLDISQVVGFFAIPRRSNEGWLGQRSWIDNLLWHHACHQVDAALWILGAETGERVSGCWGRVHPQFGMAMDLSLTFMTTSDQLVTNALTYNADEVIWELRFVTDQGVLTFRDGALLDQRGRTLVPAASVRDVSRQDNTILAALASGRSCEYDLAEILPAMRLLNLAEQSLDAARD